MSIGSNFEAAILKGIRSLEIGKYSLVHAPSEEKSIEELKEEHSSYLMMKDYLT